MVLSGDQWHFPAQSQVVAEVEARKLLVRLEQPSNHDAGHVTDALVLKVEARRRFVTHAAEMVEIELEPVQIQSREARVPLERSRERFRALDVKLSMHN